MKNLKKMIAIIVALGTLTTSGVTISASADNIIEDTKLYPCGDANFDGKINSIDVILLKKVIFGLAEPMYMYADGDTIKTVATQGEQITIEATTYIIDVQSNTIHVTGIGSTTQFHDLTLIVTDNTVFANQDIDNLKELAQYSEAILSITYDANTQEIIRVENIVMPPTINTTTIDTMKSKFTMGNSEYKYMGYVIDLEENLIKVQVDTVPGSNTPVYLLLKVTDDTIFNAEAKTLEELKELNYPYYVFTFNDYQELVSIEQLEISYQEPLIITYTNEDAKFYFNTSGNALDIILNDNYNSPIEVQVNEDTEITLDGVTTTLKNIANAQQDIDISISYQYNLSTKKYVAHSIEGESITKDIKSIYLYYGGSIEINDINTEEKSMVISDYYKNISQTYYINDDTEYSGLVSSIDDLYKYQSLYLMVVLKPTEGQNYVNDIFMQFDWTINYYTNAEGNNIITSIDVTQVEMVE